MLAVREVLVNALIHRDYSVTGSDIKVAIFDDMLEITSPGVLMIDIAQLGQGYSELRNPHLGLIFKKLNIIEQWGTCYSKIESELKERSNIQLEINDESNFVQIRFIKSVESQQIQKPTQIDSLSTKDKILLLLKEDPSLTRSALSLKIGVSDSAIKQHLADLKNKKLIERKGSDRQGYWEVKK